MSCIIGLKHKGRVYVGADTAASNDDEIRMRKDKKVFKNGPFVIGYAGSIRTGQCLMRSYWKPPNSRNIFKIIECIRAHLNEFSLIRDDGYIETTILLAYGRRMYEIQADFQVSESMENFTAIGSGKYYALGSLYTNRNYVGQIGPEEAVKEGLRASAYYCPAVRKPFIILST